MTEIAAQALVAKLEETIMEREDALSKLDEAHILVASMRLERDSMTAHADRVEADNVYLREYGADMAGRVENAEAWASELWLTTVETSDDKAAQKVQRAQREAELERRTVMRCVQALGQMTVLVNANGVKVLREAAAMLKAGAWKHFSGEDDGE